MEDGEIIGGHYSHDIVQIAPRHTSHQQTPVKAEHENNVFFAAGEGLTALLRSGPRDRSRTLPLEVGFIPEGGNCLLDPPRLRVAIGEEKAIVTVEALLYAIYELTEWTRTASGQSAL